MSREIDDSDLHGFVDGRLDAADRARVSAWLAAHPEQQARVADWAAQAEGLRRGVRQEAGERAALRLSATPRRAGWAVAAAILLAAGLGGVGGWVARGDRNPTEIARLGIEAATAYRVFANDSDRAVEISSDNRPELVAWLTQKLGHRVVPPDLAPMGYRLMGGRVLTAMYGPAAMLVYRDADDNRITVYLQPMRIGLPAPMRPMSVQAVEGYAWIDRHVGYSVMSEGDRARLHQVADHVLAGTAS